MNLLRRWFDFPQKVFSRGKLSWTNLPTKAKGLFIIDFILFLWVLFIAIDDLAQFLIFVIFLGLGVGDIFRSKEKKKDIKYSPVFLGFLYLIILFVVLGIYYTFVKK